MTETLLVLTDIPTPLSPGQALYANRRRISLFAWTCARASLFLGLVWRRYDDDVPGRFTIADAWEISAIVHPWSGWRAQCRWFREAKAARRFLTLGEKGAVYPTTPLDPAERARAVAEYAQARKGNGNE